MRSSKHPKAGSRSVNLSFVIMKIHTEVEILGIRLTGVNPNKLVRDTRRLT